MSGPEVPKSELVEKFDAPRRIEHLGLLSQLVAIVPPVDRPEAFDLARTSEDIQILSLPAPQGEAQLLEISVEREDELGEQAIMKTIANMRAILSAWDRPDEFYKLLHPDNGRHRRRHRPDSDR